MSTTEKPTLRISLLSENSSGHNDERAPLVASSSAGGVKHTRTHTGGSNDGWGRYSSTRTSTANSPALLVAASSLTYVPVVELNKKSIVPRKDINEKFLRRWGTKAIDWSCIAPGSVTVGALTSSVGMTEAEMLVVRYKLGDSSDGCHLVRSPRSPLMRLLETAKRIKNSPSPLMSRHGSMDTMTPSESKTHAAPPSSIVVKHYDTNEVVTMSLKFRLARHLVGSTAEQMARNEVFFYLKLSPVLQSTLQLAKFRTPAMYFACQDDHGDPGFLRYVCCKKGSGSVTTIGLENVSEGIVGFSFEHTSGTRLTEMTHVAAAIKSVAHLHSTFWGRCDERWIKSGVDPSPILRFSHRCGGNLISKSHHNMDLRSINVDAVFSNWGEYEPLLKIPQIQAAYRHIHRNWRNIRGYSVRIATRKETIVHGDFHFRNFAFRPITSTLLFSAATPSHTPVGSSRSPLPLYTSQGSIQQQQQQQQQQHDDGDVDDNEHLRPNSHNNSATPKQHHHQEERCEQRAEKGKDGGTPAAQNDNRTPWEKLEAQGLHIYKHMLLQQQQQQQGQYQVPFIPVPTASPSEMATSAAKEATAAAEAPRDSLHETSSTRAHSSPLMNNLPYQACFLDFQSTGPGSIAAELLYFICTSLSIDRSVFVNAPSFSKNASMLGAFHATNSSNNNSNSNHASSTNGPTSVGGRSGLTRSQSGNSSAERLDQQRPGSSSEHEHHHHELGGAGDTLYLEDIFNQIRNSDLSILQDYHASLDNHVRRDYNFSTFIKDVYLLAQHWAGIVLLDMAYAAVDERKQLKRKDPQIAEFLEWAEQTAARLMVFCAAIDLSGFSTSTNSSFGCSSQDSSNLGYGSTKESL